MNSNPADTRTRVTRNHALIAPDGHVPSVLPGFTGGIVNVLISPAMGARFTQLLVTLSPGDSIEITASTPEVFGYVMSGRATVSAGTEQEDLDAGGYFYSPPGGSWRVEALEALTQITLFEKPYVPQSGVPIPGVLFGDESEIISNPFLGDPDAQLKTLLPEIPAFDLAVNLFSFEAGARLPFVETHVMEHGLIMLAGEGIYRLGDAWYPVQAGDTIWMAPYCPQWFVAIGKTPATYLYYKDVNRPPFSRV